MRKMGRMFLVILFITAFTTTIQAKGENVKKNITKRNPFIFWGIGLGSNNYNFSLGDKIQTTPIHPDDGGARLGKQTVKFKEAQISNLNFKLKGFLPVKYVWIGAGIEARHHNTVADFRNYDGYEHGFYNVEKQDLPEAYNSHAFTQVGIDSFTYIPIVGVRIPILSWCFLDLEYGFPWSGFTVRSGHDRNGEWDIEQKESWRGYGQSTGVNLLYMKEDQYDSFGFSLSFRTEHYNPVFAGERAEVVSKAFSFNYIGSWSYNGGNKK